MFLVVGTQYLITMTQVMPFALSLGLTRRHFYTGVLSLLAVETLLHSVLLTVLLEIEGRPAAGVSGCSSSRWGSCRGRTCC